MHLFLLIILLLVVAKLLGCDINWCWVILLIIFLPILLFLLVVFFEVLMGVFGAVLLWIARPI